MISTEKAFSALPIVVSIYDKLDIDGYRKKFAEENKGTTADAETVGTDLIKYILTNTPKVKEEAFSVVALIEDKTVEEIKAQSFAKTFIAIKEIFQDQDLIGFFKSAV